MVENIEDVAPQLDFQSLAQAELAPERQVGLGKRKATQDVAPERALAACRRDAKRPLTCKGKMVRKTVMGIEQSLIREGSRKIDT